MKIKDIIDICENKESALNFIRRKQWLKNIFCPNCKFKKLLIYHNIFIKKYRCGKCGYIFSDISNTPLKGCKLSLNIVFKILWHLEFGFSIRKTAKAVGVNPKTVIKIKKKRVAILNFR